MAHHPSRIASLAFVAALAVATAACGSEGQANDVPDAPVPVFQESGPQDGGQAVAAPTDAPAAAPAVVVYKDPGCTCCEGWVDHMREAGYEVTVEDRTDMNQIKDLLGIPNPLRSCHTAEIGRYLVEGHVPSSDVRRLLDGNPEIAGIAAPGMPVGSPGMEIPGRAADRYDVMTFDGDGRTTVFASH